MMEWDNAVVCYYDQTQSVITVEALRHSCKAVLDILNLPCDVDAIVNVQDVKADVLEMNIPWFWYVVQRTVEPGLSICR